MNCVQFVSVLPEKSFWSLPEINGHNTSTSFVCFASKIAGLEFGSNGSVPHFASCALDAPSPSASPLGGRLNAWKRTSHASGKPLPSRSCPKGQLIPAKSGLLEAIRGFDELVRSTESLMPSPSVSATRGLVPARNSLRL